MKATKPEPSKKPWGWVVGATVLKIESVSTDGIKELKGIILVKGPRRFRLEPHYLGDCEGDAFLTIDVVD